MKLIYTTFPSDNVAEEIIRALLAQQLIACANVYENVRSFYTWKDKVCQDKEVIAILKTADANVEKLEAQYIKRHPYDCPCFVVMSVEKAHAPFQAWVEATCMSQSDI